MDGTVGAVRRGCVRLVVRQTLARLGVVLRGAAWLLEIAGRQTLVQLGAVLREKGRKAGGKTQGREEDADVGKRKAEAI
ncbi:hypothetical protein TanjilG_08238 [Lupinus angustifolius]|uniref:Uncharacterized protein n=1 Tax=Lupinus angustifolius TaxID=3871 RepID=A0A394D9W0_LUPAN|nr:hypothetical protein TanjilG_08238 [Lupinus angustifolius]